MSIVLVCCLLLQICVCGTVADDARDPGSRHGNLAKKGWRGEHSSAKKGWRGEHSSRSESFIGVTLAVSLPMVHPVLPDGSPWRPILTDFDDHGALAPDARQRFACVSRASRSRSPVGQVSPWGAYNAPERVLQRAIEASHDHVLHRPTSIYIADKKGAAYMLRDHINAFDGFWLSCAISTGALYFTPDGHDQDAQYYDDRLPSTLCLAVDRVVDFDYARLLQCIHAHNEDEATCPKILDVSALVVLSRRCFEPYDGKRAVVEENYIGDEPVLKVRAAWTVVTSIVVPARLKLWAIRARQRCNAPGGAGFQAAFAHFSQSS